MVFRSNNEENVRDRGLLIISLVFLLLGVGINEGLENLIATTTQNALHKIGAAEKQPTASSKGIISFVHLVKKLKPVVVNISATQTSEEDQLPPSPFGENDELNEFWRRFFGNPGDRSLGVKRTDGVMITSVEPGSVADDAGLE